MLVNIPKSSFGKKGSDNTSPYKINLPASQHLFLMVNATPEHPPED